MGFRPVTSLVSNVDPVPVRVRQRVAKPATVATFTFDVHITDTDKVVDTTMTVLRARGYDDTDALAKVGTANGEVDLGKCISALMEESVIALCAATGCTAGHVDTYIDE